MVIGKGLLAKTFTGYGSDSEYLIFASGVSNSKTSAPEDFKREQDLFKSLLAENKDKKWVYFSTCSILDPDLMMTDYVKHKIEMEERIITHVDRYHIFRLSNLAGFSENRNTILNFFSNQIKKSLPFEVWKNAERNIIDVEDVFRIADYFLQKNIGDNKMTNIANLRNYTVPYIVQCFEQLYQKKAIAREKEKGEKFIIGVSEMLPVCRLLNIAFGENYLPDLLKKYYSENEL